MDYDSMEDVLDASAPLGSHLARAGRSQSSLSLPTTSLGRGFTSCVNLAGSPRPSLTVSAVPPPLPPRPRSPNSRDSAVVLDTSDYDEPKGKESPEKKQNDKNGFTSDYDEIRTKLRAISMDESEDYDEISSRLRDSGINMQFVKAEESLQHLDTFKKYLKASNAISIAEAICTEDARMLGFLGPCEQAKSSDNGLRKIVLPTGAQLREELIMRSRAMQMAVVVSVLHDRAESAFMVRLWSEVAKEVFYTHGNFFAFVNVMQGIHSKVLTDQQWLWNGMDDSLHGSHQALTKAFIKLRETGEPPRDTAPCTVPLLHPVLELFTLNATTYTSTKSHSAEFESLWRWLEMARAWTTVADDMRDRAQNRYGKVAGDGALSQAALERLLCDMTATPERRFHPALGTIEMLLQCS